MPPPRATLAGSARPRPSVSPTGCGRSTTRSSSARAPSLRTTRSSPAELTCRLVRGRDPLRIVVDSRLRLSPDATVFSDGKRTLAAATRHAPPERRQLLQQKGIEVLEIGENPAGRVDLRELLTLLGKREISSLLVEGGAAVATSFLKENLADRLIVILAPKIVGLGINAIGDLGIRRMDDALGFSFQRVTRQGPDLILDARIGCPKRDTDAPPPGSRRGRS
ncbi:MAG: RibD family protein [Deltaproteobacteria bacterium]|nr:RibD family protein [Deltaproteobacteria bacterium]